MSDEDKRTIVRWIDLGCPIDLDYDATAKERRGYGWMLDDNRPVVSIASPAPGKNKELSRIVIGMHDYYTGLDGKSFTVTADFAVDGVAAGENLASRFKEKSQGVWELVVEGPVRELERGKLIVSIRDREGNVNRVERTFVIGR